MSKRIEVVASHLTSEEVEETQDRFPASEATIDKILKSMHVNGYCIVENFISDERAKTMNEELTKICDGISQGRNSFEGFQTKRIYALFAKTRCFDDLAIDPVVLKVVEGVLETPYFVLSSPVGIQIGKNEKRQVFHRDDAKYPLPRPHQEVIINSMWALDDFTEQNGATLLIPKSHLWDHQRLDSLRPGKNVNYKERVQNVGFSQDSANNRTDDAFKVGSEATAIKAIMPRGSVIFYAGSLYHCGGQNQTDKPRLGVILEYVASWLRPENHVLAVPREIVKKLPKRLQELLGYDIHPPFLGYVDGRDPKRTLL